MAALQERDSMSDEWKSVMTVASGHIINPMNLKDEDIHLRDIAFSLGKTCRYNGHCGGFYSVAEHCIVMSNMVPDECSMWALMHDASEAYCGDLILPIKQILPEFKEVEDRIHDAIVRKFDLDITEEIHHKVKVADQFIALVEIQHLFPKNLKRDVHITATLTELRKENPWLPRGGLRSWLSRSSGSTMNWAEAAAAFQRQYGIINDKQEKKIA